MIQQMKYMKQHWKLISTVILTTVILCVLILNLRPHQVRLDQEIQIDYAVTDPQFSQTMGHLLSTPIVAGNTVRAFQNGEQIFPAMLEAIRSAKQSITFESYIYWSGEIGKKFLVALTEKAQAGVKVHILIDWLGSQKMEKNYLDQLRSAGADIEYYHPLKWYNIFRMNNRTHRKLLVIDGKRGFTGGVGISDDWQGQGNKPEVWRDSHYEISGPAASYLQTAFMDNWLKTRPEVLHSQIYFPKTIADGTIPAQVFLSSPREGGASMRLMYLLAIAAAKKTLHIASAYFVPDELTMSELIKARKRGVEVIILLPGKYSDSHVVKAASRSTWGELLDSGIKIYEFQPAKFHIKILIADGFFVSVGSTNFDDRSLRLNNESNLNIYDANFADSQIKVFQADLNNSHEVNRAEWDQRPLTEKVKEKFFALFSDQL